MLPLLNLSTDPGCPTEELPALDAAFPVKISAPGGDNFELQVSWQDLVQDVQQVLMEREETNTRTCFLLHLDGIPLDPFAELRAVEGLSANATLRIVEEPYTMREVRIHLSHVRNLLRGVDQADIYSANDGASPSVVAIVVGESNLTDVPSEGTRRKRKSGNGPETVPDCAPPDYVLPGCKDRPLMPLQPLSRDIKPVHCLKSMRTSTWNPPPGNRRMHGDLLYLDVVTAEDRRASITASTRGFFINQSTGDEFNPRPASPSLLSHSLIDLLNQLSPIFKKSFTALQKRRLQHSPLEQLPTPFPVYCWAVAPMEHLADCMCTDDARSARLGCDDNPVTQTRDWNEEIQATRELQRQNLPERLLRDRTIFKVHSDFVMTAIRGAEAVVDGNVMAINPGEDSRSQMFVWNNLFFSLGFDVRDHYKALGGDAAAHAAPALDLAGVRAFASLDVEAICCLGTTIVDYRGYRVTAQSVVPGILEREQRQAVTYGSLDFGETVQGSRKIVSLLERSSKPLHVLRHKVLNEKDEEVELVSSVECKGIVGNDGRHYILDLLRTFPPDANFLPPLPGEDPLPDDAFPEPCKHFGFPRPYRHRLVSLRPELVEAFTRAKYEDFMKLAIAKHKSQSEGNADGSEEKEIDNREVIRNACNAVGSVSDCFFDIRFNPDVFTPTVRFPESECESVERQKLLHREASAFLLSHQIPAFLKESLDHSAVILDGATLVEFMHRFGINARYLGTVVRALEEQEERDCNRLHFLHRMLVTEVIVRAAKHLFRTYLQPVEMSTLSVAVAHFLNCFLSSCPSPGTHLATLDEGSASRNRRRSKRRGGGRGAPGAESTSWAQLTPGDLWKNLSVEAQERYSFLITSEGIDQAVEKFGLQKITLLRELCIKGGIQLLLREYVLDGRQKPAFGEEDIENLFPVAKHLWPPACDAQHLLQSAQARIQQGFLKDACDQTAEALNLYNNIFGALHPDICACLRVFARLNFILGNQAEAMIHQEKALIMSERVLGLDNPYTIQDYVICALFAFTNAQVAKALKLLYRARYLALIVCSEDHPQIATIDSNIGLMLTAVEEHDTAQRFLDKALTLNTKHCGEMSLKVALSHHFLARSYAAKGDFRSALKHEKETYTVYNEQFGKMHEKTEASYTYLQQLTDQAVVLQRNVNEICKNGSKPSIQPMQIPAPNMPYILEMLNAINGIVLPTLSCEDLQKLKAEVKELEDMINQEPPPLDVEALIAETANQEESPAGQES